MLDDDDFPAEPQRAPDPSVEEMLRRARAVRLDDAHGAAYTSAPHFRPFAAEEGQPALGGWLRDCALLVIGVLLGALVACTAIRVGTLVSSPSTLVQPASQNTPTTAPPATTTATPLPTPTDTPSPSPTVVPTATAAAIPTPPTTNEVVSLVQAYYDNDSPFAGTYVLVNITNMQLQHQDDSQLMVCIAYQVATAASPVTVADSNTRPFTPTFRSCASAVFWISYPHSARVLGRIFVFSLEARKHQGFHGCVLSPPIGADDVVSWAGGSDNQGDASSLTTTPVRDVAARILSFRQVAHGRSAASRT